MSEIHRLRLYDDAGAVAAEYSTDPGQPLPYLVIPDSYVSQEVDLLHGRAKVGSAVLEVVDVARVPADQDTGHLTYNLADVDGKTARIGRRAHWEIWTGAWENALNGVISDVELDDSYSSLRLSVKDQRENERRTQAFVRATTSSVLPRGVIAGFGLNAATGEYLIQPTVPLRLRYNEGVFPAGTSPLISGQLQFPKRDDRVPIWQVMNDKLWDNLFANDENGLFTKVRLLWRPSPYSGAYNVAVGLMFGGSGMGKGTFKDASGVVHNVTYITAWNFWWPAGASRPANGSDIDVIFGYNGPPSKDYPLHIDGITFGQLLKGLYDGDYSGSAPPGVLYDSAAVLALTEPALGRITEPLDTIDGIWKWTEDNIYAPLGAAPALDAQGLVSPVRDRLPAADAVLLQLDDTNCEPIPGWSHGDSDAINMVSVEYSRFLRVPADTDPFNDRSAGDGVVEKPVTVGLNGETNAILAASIALLGERPLRIKSSLLGAVGGFDGEPVSGDITDELGAQIAYRRGHEAIDRWLLGGQHFRTNVMRSALGTRRVGDWCIIACSWMPNYVSRERGANALAQILNIKPLDSAWAEVHLVDAGPNNSPVGLPTLGALTLDTVGVVSIPVSVIPAGAEARVDYAVNTTEPSATSPLWRFAGRVSVVSTVTTPPNPAGTVVWVRSRGEKEGRRPSAWTAATSIAVTSTPRVSSVRVEVSDTGSAVITWVPNTYALGVKLTWGTHLPIVIPSLGSSADVNASLGTYSLPSESVRRGEMLTVEVEPWTGWTGSAVSGTAGSRVQSSAVRSDPGRQGYALENFRDISWTTTSVTYGWTPGVSVELVFVYDRLFSEPYPDDPWPAADHAPAAVLPAHVTTYTLQIPLIGQRRYFQFEPRATESLVSGDIRRGYVDAPGPVINAVLDAVELNALVDLTLQVRATPQAYPITATVYENTKTGTLLATHVFTADATITKLTYATLGGRAAAAADKKFWYAKLIDAAGSETWVSDFVSVPGTGSIKLASQFAAAIVPPEIVAALPSLPHATYPSGRIVVLTTDGKLYRSTGTTWTAAVPAVDLTGQVTTTQITDDAITTPKINALAVTAAEIATNAITAGKIAADAVTAGTIAAGAISTSALFVAGVVDATAVAANAITAVKIAAGAVTADKLDVTELSAVTAETGTLVVTGDLQFEDTIDVLAGEITHSSSGAGQSTVEITAAFDVRVTLAGIVGSGANRVASIAGATWDCQNGLAVSGGFSQLFNEPGLTHGMTTVAATDTAATVEPDPLTTGGLRVQGTGTAATALTLASYGTGDITTKTTAALASTVLSAAKASGTGIANLAANSNILAVRNNATTRFILDGDGDSHQDVGTAWTNFDAHDDVALLNCLAAEVSRQDDPVREQLASWLNQYKPELERLKLVSFEEDGHPFVNMSRLNMLLVGAVRQLAGRLEALESRLA